MQSEETLRLFIPTLSTSLTLRLVLSGGNAVRDGVLRGGTGASGGGLTWPAARGGSVQGFPWGHYGPCAPDRGAKAGPVEAAWAHKVRLPWRCEAQMPGVAGTGTEQKERTGTEIAERAARGSHIN